MCLNIYHVSIGQYKYQVPVSFIVFPCYFNYLPNLVNLREFDKILPLADGGSAVSFG